MRTLCILALCALLTPASAFAGFKYRCVDAQGRSHYANDLKNLPPECRQRAAEEARQRAADEAAAKGEEDAAVRKELNAILGALEALQMLNRAASARFEDYVEQLEQVDRLIRASLADIKTEAFRVAISEALYYHAGAKKSWEAALKRQKEELRREWAEWRAREAEWRRLGMAGSPRQPDERLIPVDKTGVRDGLLCALNKIKLARVRVGLGR